MSAYDQFLAHLFGDYVIQTDHQAAEKTQDWRPALIHGITYTLPFVALTRSPGRLAGIALSHALIDRYRLAKHVCWAKNQLAPERHRYPWSHAGPTGYHSNSFAPYQHDQTDCTVLGKPDYLAVWLMIAADNSIHLLLNRLILRGED
jgi:hypothetical protein